MPANIFDDQRRAWIAAHAGVFLFQKRRAELLAKTIRARTRAQVGARPDPHDDQITPPLIFRSTSTTTGSYEAALVAVCALLAPLGWAAGKAAYLALVALIPERLRAYPIPALFWSAAASATPLVLFYDPAPGLTDTLVLPWLLAQLPAAFAAAALYGLAEGWLAVDGSSDWWPLTPLVGDVDDDLILDSTILPMPTVLDDAPAPPRRRIPPSIGTRRRTPPTVSWRPIISGITALTIVTLWYVWMVADTTLDPPRIAPVHGTSTRHSDDPRPQPDNYTDECKFVCGRMVGVDRYLSVSEIAEQLELSINTLNTRIRSGNFPPPDAMIGTRYQGWKASTICNLHPDEHGDMFDVRAAQLAPAATEVRRITEKIRALSAALDPELGPQKTDIMRKLSVLGCRLEESARAHTFGVQMNARSLGSLLPPSDDLPHTPQHSVETIDIAGLEIVPIMLPPQEITQAAALNALVALADDLEAIPQRVSSPDTGYVPASIRDETAHIAAALRSLLAQAPASAHDTDANTQ